NLSWGSDLREILVRYGWPRGWERVRESGLRASLGDESLISHYSGPDHRLLPPAEVLADGAEITAGEWDVESRRERAGYDLPAPGGRLEWLRPVDHQIAAFHRPDSARVVVAY